MRGVEPGEDEVVVHFDHDEAGLLAGIVDQLTEVLDGESQPAPGARRNTEAETDPFAQWEADFSVDDEPTVDDFADEEVDPVIRRLFPDAYPQDPAASHDFRRFTQAAQRRSKLVDAQVVVADLQHTDRRGRCRVPSAHTGAWLKTLASVRLALAVRLDITDEVSADEASQRGEEDPRSWVYEVYAWVGWLQECLLAAI